uniref:DNA repair protein RAD51 homolog 3-like n=1 Tax=Styela clava TaxID=7725 RepID=UPI0019398085|nr:DNA repair protein RAD51 homolog 3-like [Styela clava]
MAYGMRHVLSLPFDTLLRSKLICCGFSTIDDFKVHLDVDKLKQAVGITDEEAAHILNVIKPYLGNELLKASTNVCGVFEGQLSKKVVMKSVACMLKENLKEIRHIVSFSSEVDKLMGGGFPLGRITEIAGEAGLGKTQFCFQLCVDVQIPACLGGVDGEAVYLDVEGTFFPQRVAQITNATVQHCHQIADLSGSPECIESMKDFTTDKVMSRIFLFSCRNCVQLLAATHQMKEFLKSHQKVKLLVVDSVAQCVRGEEDMRSRSKFLMTLGRIFLDIAMEFDIAVVLTNQVSTKINDKQGTSYNIPALGIRWSHLASVKLMLNKRNQSRFLHQYKSPDMKDGVAEYRVVSEGIRDIEDLARSQLEEDSATSSSAWKEYYNKQNTESRTQEDSSIQFYPITQGLATEMMTEWELNDEKDQFSNQSETRNTENCAQPITSNTQFPKEDIPSKWIELSQRQLCDHAYEMTETEHAAILDADNNVVEKGKHETSLTTTNGRTFDKYVNLDKENRNSATRETKQTIQSSRKLRQKVESILQQTVETMLSCEVPVKAPPTKKRCHSGDEFPQSDKSYKKSCTIEHSTNKTDKEHLVSDRTEDTYEIDKSTPPSPILKNKTRRNKKLDSRM